MSKDSRTTSHLPDSPVQTDAENPPRVAIWRMLAGCAIVFCVASVWIAVAFPDHALDLWFYFAYMTVACTFLPFPTPQVVMDYGGRYGPLLIAIIGGIGSSISVTIDYALVTVVFRYEKIARIKTTHTYLYIERIFRKAAFVSLVIGSLTPIPFEPIKLLACVARYSIVKYLLAILVGRTLRYYLLGMLQKELLIPRKYLYGSILLLVTIETVRRLVKWLRDRG